MAKQKRFKVTLVRGKIGCSESQRRTLDALGLGKRLSTNQFNDSPALRGQLKKVQHLVKIEVLN